MTDELTLVVKENTASNVDAERHNKEMPLMLFLESSRGDWAMIS